MLSRFYIRPLSKLALSRKIEDFFSDFSRAASCLESHRRDDLNKSLRSCDKNLMADSSLGSIFFLGELGWEGGLAVCFFDFEEGEQGDC